MTGLACSALVSVEGSRSTNQGTALHRQYQRNTRSGERVSKYTEKVWTPPVSGLGHLAERTFGYENILNSSCGALSGTGGIMRPLARRKAERQAVSQKVRKE